MIYDGNSRPFSSLDSYNVAICRPPAFAGATANDRGDSGGTGTPYTLFTVTGDVIVRFWGVCSTDLAGATATIEVGVTGNTATLLPLTTATDIDASDIWADTTPTLGATLLADVLGPYLIANGNDIIETVKTADITSGNVYYIALWRPVSIGSNAAGVSIAGSVVAAGTQT